MRCDKKKKKKKKTETGGGRRPDRIKPGRSTKPNGRHNTAIRSRQGPRIDSTREPMEKGALFPGVFFGVLVCGRHSPVLSRSGPSQPAFRVVSGPQGPPGPTNKPQPAPRSVGNHNQRKKARVNRKAPPPPLPLHQNATPFPQAKEARPSLPKG